MFAKVEIQNFKSIIKTEVRLSPLTVIVGASGSGKSNLIKALEFFAAVPRIGLLATVTFPPKTVPP